VAPRGSDDIARRLVRAITAAKRDAAQPSPLVAIV
jgi:hypothetical protein